MYYYVNKKLQHFIVLLCATCIIVYCQGLITGWAIALTCYISHSAKHRKWLISTLQRAKIPKPILMKLSMVDYVLDPTHQTTLVVVAQRGWSGQICDLSHLRVSFRLGSFFLFLLSSSRAQVPFLTDRDDLYANTCVSGQGCAF